MPKATPSRNLPPSEAPTPLKWGILATGVIAHKFTADLHASGAGKAVACGSRTIEGARTFAATHGIAKAYGSYGELARDPEVEAVYVATPHPFHYNDALACLRQKKAVLCEKPLCVNAAQSTKLFEAAAENGVFLMEGIWSHFLPAQVKAREWLAQGQIGEPVFVHADFGFRAPVNAESRLFNPALTGGALLDVGIYTISMALSVAGNKVPKVKAIARMTHTGVDETTNMILDWHSGLQASLTCSIGHAFSNTATIYGTRGKITLPDFWMAREATLETDAGRTLFHDNRTTVGYDFEARAATGAIRSGSREIAEVSQLHSLRVATTMDTVRKQIGLVYPGEN